MWKGWQLLGYEFTTTAILALVQSDMSLTKISCVIQLQQKYSTFKDMSTPASAV